MASAGRVILLFKGDYDNAVQYQNMDAVAYQGSTYVCKQTTIGNVPTNTTYWQIMAKGATDAAGLSYDNAESGLDAENVQDAIDELNSDLSSMPLVDFGTVSISRASGANRAVITFKKNFTKAPNVYVTPVTEEPTRFIGYVSAISSTGATVGLWNTGSAVSTSVNLRWTAIGE